MAQKRKSAFGSIVAVGGGSPIASVNPPRVKQPVTSNWQAVAANMIRNQQPIDMAKLHAAGMTGNGTYSTPAKAAAPKIDQTVPLVDDAQAKAARAQALFDASQQVAQINSASTYDSTDLAEAIRRLETQRPNDENSAKISANSQGLASSSTLAKGLGDIASGYARSEGDLQTAYDRREADRAAQKTATEQQGPISQASIDAALADRQAQRDSESAASNSLVANTARDVAKSEWKSLGLSPVLAANGKVVVKDRNGKVIPGAFVQIKGHKTTIRLPKGY